MITQNSTTRQQIPKLSRDEIVSVATLFCATLLSMSTIACRWFITYQGEGIRLLLVMISLTAALFLVGRISTTGRLERISRWVFAMITVIALLTWSPGFAFAMLVTMPIMLTLVVPPLMSWTGYQFQMIPIVGDIQPAALSTQSPVLDQQEQVPDRVPELIANQSVPEIDETEEMDEDPWAFLHVQFASDPSLTQNVSQWQEPDGTRCIIGNIRCRFSTADETCIVQLPFWPLLDGVPEVYCRVASGPAASIKTTQELPHGLRLEVRLEDRSRDTNVEQLGDVVVEVVASLAAESNEAAA